MNCTRAAITKTSPSLVATENPDTSHAYHFTSAIGTDFVLWWKLLICKAVVMKALSSNRLCSRVKRCSLAPLRSRVRLWSTASKLISDNFKAGGHRIKNQFGVRLAPFGIWTLQDPVLLAGLRTLTSMIISVLLIIRSHFYDSQGTSRRKKKSSSHGFPWLPSTHTRRWKAH